MIQINTKVKITKNGGGHSASPGDEGYVVTIDTNCLRVEYGINFISGYISRGHGHNLNGRLDKSTGNWIPETDLEVIC